MEYSYEPEGVCSREMIIDVENGIIKDVRIVGGCPGNTLAVSAMVKGNKIEDVIRHRCICISPSHHRYNHQ